MSDRTFEMVNHRYPWGHFAYPSVEHVDPAPFHESTTPQDRLQTTTPKQYPRTFTTTDPVAGTRRCGRCFEVKDLTQFYRHATNACGRMHICMVCNNEATSEFRREQRRKAAA